jgi:feruloyl esterase
MQRYWLSGLIAVVVGLVGPVVAHAQTRSASVPCERLASVALPNTTVSSAQVVPAGRFTPPGAADAKPFADLPAFCRVVGSTRMLDSDVKFEVWLPERWTGDVMPAGGNFWGGPIVFARMREILLAGAVTVGTNLGIEGFTGPSFAKTQPERFENLKMEPLHAVVEHAKALTRSYYAAAPTFTLMNECGGGGSRDVLSMVQRFPNDLDAAVAVNFTNYGTRHGVSQMWLYDATHRTPESVLPTSKLPMLHQAVLNACDLNDGVKDNVIENPPACTFDPAVIACKGGDAPNCLTAGQVEAVRRIYQTPRHERTGEPIYGRLEPGSELGWADMVGPEPYRYAMAYYRNLVFDDPNWTYQSRRPNFGSDIDRAERLAGNANATNPDLSAFVNRGGKLLLVGGWVDDLAPQNVVTYYENVIKTMGGKARDSVRLFMVPGMHHCFGGVFPGAYQVDFDPVQAVKEWKASGKAPDQIVVQTSGQGWPTRKRLVCAYPNVSTYKGSGDVGDPANFTCRQP